MYVHEGGDIARAKNNKFLSLPKHCVHAGVPSGLAKHVKKIITLTGVVVFVVVAAVYVVPTATGPRSVRRRPVVVAVFVVRMLVDRGSVLADQTPDGKHRLGRSAGTAAPAAVTAVAGFACSRAGIGPRA